MAKTDRDMSWTRQYAQPINSACKRATRVVDVTVFWLIVHAFHYVLLLRPDLPIVLLIVTLMSIVVGYNDLADGLEKPLSPLNIRDWQEWPWLPISIDECDTRRFSRYRLQILERHHPQLFELPKLDKDDSVVGQESDSIIAWYVEMCDIVFVEVGSLPYFLQPRLTKRFAFRERPQDTIRWDVSRQSYPLDIALIKDGRRVSDTLGRGRNKVKDTDSRLGE